MTAELTREFLRLLREDPEFREEVRRQVLTDELLALPELVRHLLDLQRQTLEVVREMAARMSAFAEAVNARLDRVEAQLQENARQIAENSRQIASLTERMDRVEGRLDRVETRLGRLETDVGFLKGRSLEEEWVRKAPSYLGRWVQALRVSTPDTLRYTLQLARALAEDEVADLLGADIIAEGQSPEGTPLWVVVEVSWTVGAEDVEWARRRADLLARLGVSTVAVAAGKAAPEDVLEEARRAGVWVLLDGRRVVGDDSH